ncbi:MAG: outer-membrane lipoprotein carrier protein LolA [Deferribacteraceae bacterium]|jgi:outer membrane lipoprotein-sorting protein|nr:outer-membrane lipoprotein carrier protein LolA [Deferribacteraceae bacterium]
MRKLFITIFLITQFTASALAADKNTTPQLDTFLKLKTFYAEFVQENYYPGMDNFTYKGKVYIIRSEKALWDYENPVEYYLLEPGKITHYSQSLKQLIKIKTDNRSASDPTGILLGIFLDSSKIKEQFSISEKGNTITLVPHSGLGLENIVITMNKNIVEEVFSKDSAGSTITVKFSNVKQNQSINSSLFQKNLPEGTEIFEQ